MVALGVASTWAARGSQRRADSHRTGRAHRIGADITDDLNLPPPSVPKKWSEGRFGPATLDFTMIEFPLICGWVILPIIIPFLALICAVSAAVVKPGIAVRISTGFRLAVLGIINNIPDLAYLEESSSKPLVNIPLGIIKRFGA